MKDADYVRSYGKPVLMDHNMFFGTAGDNGYYVKTTGAAKFLSVNVPTATISNATISGDLVVNGVIHGNEFIKNIVKAVGGQLYVSPTFQALSTTTVTCTAVTTTQLSLTLSDNAINGTDYAGATWYKDSKVMLSGTLTANTTGHTEEIIFSSVPGVVTASMSNSNKLQIKLDYNGASTYFKTGTLTTSDVAVMMYQISIPSGNTNAGLHPIGIYIKAYGTDNQKSYIDIFGGTSNTPNARLGLLTGLGNMPSGSTINGWGIYTDNGFFKGIVEADGGIIGNWTIGESSMYYSSDTPSSSSIVLAPGGKSASVNIGGSGTSQKSWAFTVKNLFGIDIDGKLYSSGGEIAGWQISSNALLSGTWGADNSAMLCIGTSNAKSVGGSDSISGWVFTAGANFGVTKTGALYADSAHITGEITANTGYIGGTSGWKIESQKISSATNGTVNTLGADNSLFLATTNLGSNTSIAGRSGSDWRLTVGSNFGVTNTGALYATSGKIANWTIKDTYLATGTATEPAANSLLLSPAGTTNSYTVAGTSKSGWMITAGTTFGVNKDGGVYATSGTIGGCSIVDGTLEIPAANITGTLNAAQISAGALSRNLMINTLNPVTTPASQRPRILGQVQDTVVNGTSTLSVATHGIRVTNTGAIRTYIRFGNSTASSGSLNGLEPDHTYTMSFDAKCKLQSSATGTANTTTHYFRIMLYDDKATTGTFKLDQYKNIATLSQANKGQELTARCEFTFTIPDNVTILYFICGSNLTTNSHYAAGDYIELSNIMLQEAAGASAWCPANEDLYAASLDAAKTATNYIFADSSGIKISYTTDPSNYLQITSDDISIYKNINNVNTQVATYGESITLGQIKADETRIQIDNDSMDIIYRDENLEDTTLAQFGSLVIIGNSNGANINIDDSGININNSDGNSVVQISGDNFTIGQETSSKFMIMPNKVILEGDDGNEIFKISGKSSYINQRENDKLYPHNCVLQAGEIINVTDTAAISPVQKLVYKVRARFVKPSGVSKTLSQNRKVTENTSYFNITLNDGVFIASLTAAGADHLNNRITAYINETISSGSYVSVEWYDITLYTFYTYQVDSASSLNMTGNMNVNGEVYQKIQSWHSNQFSNASGDIWADKCGNVVYVHGWHQLNNGVTKESLLVTIPWKPLGTLNVVTQNDAAGYNYGGYLDFLWDGRLVVGTSWSGWTRYSFCYLTNDT